MARGKVRAAACVTKAKFRRLSTVVTKIPFLKSDKFDVAAAKAAVADADLDALDTTTKVYNAMSGRLVPQLAHRVNALMKELETVTDELGKYKKASPSAKSSGAAAPVADDNATFAQRVEAALAGV